MNETKDAWTMGHDLALIYIALAYGTDRRLSDRELDTLTGLLQHWHPDAGREEVHEIVMEALAIFLEEGAEEEVVRSMKMLRETLSEADRRRALEEIVRIAEADGVLLSSERNLISLLADIWEVRAAGRALLERSAADAGRQPGWTVLHDISLICIVVAHSTDNDLSDAEIAAILKRLRDWQPNLQEDEVRLIVREALQFYAGGPDEQALRRSVRAVRDFFPMMQRLALLDDLFYIAEVDGTLDEHEKQMIASLAKAWEVSVRFNGRNVA